ncbi:MAG TPA: ABC transporter permease [Syntrophobacteraceae bacterium]|nr:ABC transporter permease [Syntrophobacteraceae bacterium]
MTEPDDKRPSYDGWDWWALGYQLLGIGAALLLWQILSSPLFLPPQFSKSFSPENAFLKLWRFVGSDDFFRHATPSLLRIGIGLGIASTVGIPIGLLTGYYARVHQLTNIPFQFIRMISPLAWMPLAVMAFGVGTRPVCFLISMAAVWPIILNTSNGVRNVDPLWEKVVRMLGGKSWAVLSRAIIPAIIPDILTGLRIALGISWVVFVPAEMLGVSTGLGYYILDTRDRLDYGELMAVILIVGLFGYLSDLLIRILQHRFSWRDGIT